MSKDELLAELDELTEEWYREAMASFWKDGCGKIDRPSAWDEFWKELETKVGNCE